MTYPRRCLKSDLKLPHAALRRIVRLAVVLLLLFPLSNPRTIPAQALRVQPRTIRPRPQFVCVLCSLTVTTSPGTVSFALVQGGTATASAPIVITTNMQGVSLLSQLNLYGYFASSTAALTDGRSTPDNIPSSDVYGMIDGSTTPYPFSSSYAIGTAGASLLIFSTGSLASLGCIGVGASCRSDTLTLQINLSTLTNLPAGSYSGTLILQAEAL